MTVDDYLQRAQHFGPRIPPDQYGVWDIHGEDPSPGLGGYHESPFLERVEGTYLQAVNHALTLPKFVLWGSGGCVVAYVPPPVRKL